MIVLFNKFLILSFLIFFTNNLCARSIEEQISFELDSLKYAKYLDEADSNIAKFYSDFSRKNISEYSLAFEDNLSDDSCFCRDSIKIKVKEEYRPYGWILGGVAGGAVFNIVGGVAMLIGNEKAEYKTSTELRNLSKQCSKQEVKKEQSKIRFRYTVYGVIAGILVNSLIVYAKTKDD